jgi:hypothetical protein
MMTVYLSGPITGISDYADRFEKAQRYLEHLGDLSVINPAAEPPRPNWGWADWMIYDLSLVRKANVVVTMPGADRSLGCKVEVAFAEGLGLPIVDLVDARWMLSEAAAWRKKA